MACLRHCLHDLASTSTSDTVGGLLTECAWLVTVCSLQVLVEVGSRYSDSTCDTDHSILLAEEVHKVRYGSCNARLTTSSSRISKRQHQERSVSSLTLVYSRETALFMRRINSQDHHRSSAMHGRRITALSSPLKDLGTVAPG